jgi:hypothetical protein
MTAADTDCRFAELTAVGTAGCRWRM